MLAFAPLDGAVGAASSAVATLATAVAPLAGGNATAVAIVAFTVAVRLLVSPLSYLQTRSQPAATPEAALGGCLPALLQAPFFFVMYRLFTSPPDGSGLLARSLAGVPLGHHVADGLAGAAGPVFAVLFAALAALAWWSSRRMRAAAAGVRPGPAAGPEPPGAAAVARLLPLLPYGTLLAAAVLPLAAGLYLVTTTAWTAVEQPALRRLRGRKSCR